jgi:predicted MFS family arabinose efflux permease
MWTVFGALALSYCMSQFYRAFLAVLAPVLGTEIGATAEDLAFASGVWFAAFAAMQIPVGWALDRIGPRRTAAWLFGVFATGGAVLFATAQGPGTITLAMALIGVGCAPLLMASMYIFARSFRPAVFGSLAGLMIGIGSAGNLASAAPLALAVDAMGWRTAIWVLAGITCAIAVMLFVVVRDPPPVPGGGAGGNGRIWSVLRQPAVLLLLPITFVNYAPAAGIRGLWAGPYMADVYGLDADGIGLVTLAMAVAMIAGNFCYGPADRIFGTRKWVVLGGCSASALTLLALWAAPDAGVMQAAALLACLGFFGTSFVLVMAHGRSYFPPHLVGRGISLLNLLSIGGAGVLQMASGRLHAASSARGLPPAEVYGSLFLFFALLLIAGGAIYLFSRDRLD